MSWFRRRPDEAPPPAEVSAPPEPVFEPEPDPRSRWSRSRAWRPASSAAGPDSWPGLQGLFRGGVDEAISPESSRIDCNRFRLPRSDCGPLIRSAARLTKTGTAASAPTETSAMAVAVRAGRRIRSAKSIPMPRPIAVCVNESKLSIGISSSVFAMDIEKDIAYSYTSRSKNKKENGNLLTRMIGHRPLSRLVWNSAILSMH